MHQNLKKYGKLFGYVVLGVIATAVIYELLILGMTKLIRASSGSAYLILAPVAVLSGSFVTGFLSHSDVKTKVGLLFMAPGLYFAVVFTWMNFTYGDRDFAIAMLVASLAWIIASWGGTLLGHSFKSKGTSVQHLLS